MSAITLRDVDNRDDDGTPYEFTGDTEQVSAYLDGPLRRDLRDDTRLSEAIRLVRAGEIGGANEILRRMSVYLR